MNSAHGSPAGLLLADAAVALLGARAGAALPFFLLPAILILLRMIDDRPEQAL
jgi:hypothetical protein